jgi:hypothetical protein
VVKKEELKPPKHKKKKVNHQNTKNRKEIFLVYLVHFGALVVKKRKIDHQYTKKRKPLKHGEKLSPFGALVVNFRRNFSGPYFVIFIRFNVEKP